MKYRNYAVTVYSVCHFFVDFSCAYLIFSSVTGTNSKLLCLLLYNFFAFAMQMPIGLLADLLNRNSIVAALGCTLTAGAYLLGGFPIAMSVAAGIGNALFHVGGGVDVLNFSDKAGLLGIYVSPGAMGLFIGTMSGKSGSIPYAVPAVVMLASAAVILTLHKRSDNVTLSFEGTGKGTLVAAVCLFAVVCLRSYVGMLFSFPWKSGVWAVIFVCAVVAGKMLGGFAYDKFGAVKTSIVSLVICSVMFMFSSNAVVGIIAVLLFNMTMPVTLRMIADLFPKAKGFSFGLLTFALFIGFAFVWLGFDGFGSGLVYAIGSVLSLALLILAVKKSC